MGQKFGRLTVLELALAKPIKWLCVCECGKQKAARPSNLKKGLTRSCGCLRTETTVARSTLHGFAKRGQIKTTWRIWVNIQPRCEDPENHAYAYYGGRGIRLCDRWKVFENFLEDMGERPGSKYSLDRINNDGNYELANCRWATRSEQMRNSRQARIIEYRGRKMSMAEAAEISAVSYGALQARLDRGWPPEKAIEANAYCR
jgi:hypothetical protein